MTKYCTKCGAANTDDARFCSACGNPLTLTSQQGGSWGGQPQGQAPSQPQPAQPTQYQPPPQAYQQSRAERALNIFTKNLGLILPVLILFIADLIVGAIVGAIVLITVLHGVLTAGSVVYTPIFFGGAFAFVFGPVFWLLTGIFLSIVVVEARNAASSQGYSLSQAWGEVRSRLSDVIIMAVVLGVVNTLLGLIPFIGWLLDSLFFAYIVVAETLMFTQNSSASTALTRAVEWVRSMANSDALTLVVLIVASILSEIPILNFFTIPYAALITLVYLFDNGVQRFTPSTTPMTQPTPPPPPTM